MHAPVTTDTPCRVCGGDGPIRVVRPDGAEALCVLDAVAVLASAEDGVHVALVVDAAGPVTGR